MSYLRDQGNEQFKAGNYLKAAAIYTQALKADPSNPALYSNRSAAFLQLSKISKALADAEMTIKLKPEWEKGYFRKGCALEAMKNYDEALDAFMHALKINPRSNEIILKQKFLAKLLKDQKRISQSSAATATEVATKATTSKSTSTSTSTSSQETNKSKKNDNVNNRYHGDGDVSVIPSDLEKSLEKFRNEIFAEISFAWSESNGNIEPSVNFISIKKEKDKTNERDGSTKNMNNHANDNDNVEKSNENNKNPDNGNAECDVTHSQVIIKEAFDSPNTLNSCVSFLRQHSMDQNAFAAFLVVPKERIAYPQVWKGRGAKEWKHGNKKGIFAQLENLKSRKIWFFPCDQKQDKCVVGVPEELDIETYAILPPLFR